jgi:hypothetical protein
MTELSWGNDDNKLTNGAVEHSGLYGILHELVDWSSSPMT